MQPDEVRAVAAEAVAAVEGAWARVLGAEQAIQQLIRSGRTAGLAALVRELRSATAAAQQATEDAAVRLAREGVPAAYALGGIKATARVVFGWDQAHVEAVTALAQDTYADLLAASQQMGRSSAALIRQIREAAAQIGPTIREGETAQRLGRRLADGLARRGVTAVVYRDGSRHGIRDYMDVVARTKTAVAYNEGAFAQIGRAEIGWVELFDGTGCGLDAHGVLPMANGMIMPLAEARNHPIAHPRCQRSFGARPDITTAAQAKTAALSTTPEQRADQAAFEAARAAATAARAQNRAAARRRAAVIAKHGGVAA
jgi:hypothetical protein